ncbi:MAG: exopolysaccharide biosynthesis protein, partial [Limisphaerales bacterium]
LGLPIPPIIPLSNMFPAIAILLIALSMMEEDGMLIWAGYFVASFTVGYFLVWADVIVWAVLKYSGPVRSWLGI